MKISPEEQARRLERVVRHPTRWKLRKLVGELQLMLNRLEPIVERLEAEDEQHILRLRVLSGGAIKRRNESGKSATLKTAENLGL